MACIIDKKGKILVSIVVPVYNAELYLHKCINSVLFQTYSNLELLLVDDGSTDSSSRICDDFANKDGRVKVLHKENGGVCESRNLGLKMSRGDFLMFLDSDDFWISNVFLESFVAKAQKDNLDIVRGEYCRVDENGNKIGNLSRNTQIQKTVYSSFEMVNGVIRGANFIWLFLLRSKVLKNMEFDTSVVFGEDTYFLMQMFCQKLRCGYLPDVFYAYRQIKTSASKRVNLKSVIDSFSFCDKFYECAFKTSDRNMSNFCMYNSIMMYYWTLQTLASDSYYDKYKEIDAIVHLTDLEDKVCKRAKSMTNCNFPLHIYMGPRWGILLFRLRWNIGKIFRMLHIIR